MGQIAELHNRLLHGTDECPRHIDRPGDVPEPRSRELRSRIGETLLVSTCARIEVGVSFSKHLVSVNQLGAPVPELFETTPDLLRPGFLPLLV
jgi:hypothetical protein